MISKFWQMAFDKTDVILTNIHTPSIHAGNIEKNYVDYMQCMSSVLWSRIA